MKPDVLDEPSFKIGHVTINGQTQLTGRMLNSGPIAMFGLNNFIAIQGILNELIIQTISFHHLWSWYHMGRTVWSFLLTDLYGRIAY